MISNVIPSIAVIKRILEKIILNDTCINNIKILLIERINNRFNKIEDNFLYKIATFLDLRYKNRFFSNSTIYNNVKTQISIISNKNLNQSNSDIFDVNYQNKNQNKSS